MAHEVISPTRSLRKSWISNDTFTLIKRRREARLKGDLVTYRSLNRARRSALRHDKQVWALEEEAHLANNRPHDAFQKTEVRQHQTIFDH